MLENKIKELILALNANTAALLARQPAPHPEAFALTQEVDGPTAPAAPKPAAPAPTAPAAPAAPAPIVDMTPEQLNALLVEQFKRLGNNITPINEAFATFGATNIPSLPIEKRSEFIEYIKGLKA